MQDGGGPFRLQEIDGRLGCFVRPLGWPCSVVALMAGFAYLFVGLRYAGLVFGRGDIGDGLLLGILTIIVGLMLCRRLLVWATQPWGWLFRITSRSSASSRPSS